MDAKNTHVMNERTFPNVGAPHLVLLGESGLKSVCGKMGMDVSLVAAPVTGMDSDCFAKQFFDFWHAWLLSW